MAWIFFFLKRREKLDYKRFQQAGDMQSKIMELINGMQEIKLHNAERQKRWGVLSILLVMGLLLGVTVFIRYPDMLEGKRHRNNCPLAHPPQSRDQRARIVHLFTTDGQPVNTGAPITELQNNTGYEQIMAISSLSDSMRSYLRQDNLKSMSGLLINPMVSLGEAQPFYNQLLQSISAYLLLKNERIYARRAGNLQLQMDHYQSAASITKAEARLTYEEIRQAAERFAANEKLYKDKVISKQEYFDEAARLRQKQLMLQSQQKDAIQHNITAGDNSRQMLEIEAEKSEKERSLQLSVEEAVRNLQNFAQSWKLQYLLLAPYSGTVHFLRPLQEGEQSVPGEELFAVTPEHYHFRAQASMPATGAGKLKTGQKVHLLLAQFPYNEYGYLEGIVANISAMPWKPAAGNRGETFYQVEIGLSDHLVTSFHKQIPFSPEMAAQAQIITKDRNLLQRLVGMMAGWNK